jgi:phage shock protein C
VNDHLYRSRSDRMLAGVAGGVAEHFELDPSLVRVGWAILVILTGGIFLLIYIVMAIVVPEEPIGSGGWTSAGGWTGAGGSGRSDWTSSWPSSTTPSGSPAGSTQGSPASAAPGDPAPPPQATGTAGPGFAAPIAGGWTPGVSSGTGPAEPPDGSARDARRAARDARHAARQANRAYRREHPGSGGVIAGLFLVAIGLFFLVRALVPALDIDRYWPAGLIALGVLLVALSIRRTPGGNGP